MFAHRPRQLEQPLPACACAWPGATGASLGVYALIGVFFIVLYWFMTMTGEDISQFADSSHQSPIEILQYTYSYLPRLGELYQHLVIRYYEPIARLNLSLIPRLADGIFAVAFLYVLTYLALLRRPRLEPRSALSSGIIFVLLTLTPANAIFLSRFSCLHNYVLGYLITAAFCIPFATFFLYDAKNKPKGTTIYLFLSGILTGYSTEVSPAILFLLLGSIVAIRYGHTRRVHCWMIGGLSGLLTGVALFYATGGLNSRLGGPYAIAYDYALNHSNDIRLGALAPLLISHLQFNARSLWPWVVLYAGILAVCFARFKQDGRSEWRRCMLLTGALLLFSLIYLGVSSLIRVDDELYGRYMASVYISIAISSAQFADVLMSHALKVKERQVLVLLGLLAGWLLLINVDMFAAFQQYNGKARGIVRQLQRRPSVSLHEPDLEMPGSPLFNLRQYPILEPWANPTAFGVKIQYLDGGERAQNALPQ